MNRERQPRLGKGPTIAGSAVLALAAIAAACGGVKGETQAVRGSDGTLPTPAARNLETPLPSAQTPLVIETPKPTPEATPTSKPEPKNLFEAEVKPTTFGKLVESIDNAFQAKPVVTIKAIRPGGQVFEGQISRESQGMTTNLNKCQSGVSPDPRFRETDMRMACADLATLFDAIYRQTGDQLFYAAAVNARNFYLSQYPGNTEKIDELIRSSSRTYPSSSK